MSTATMKRAILAICCCAILGVCCIAAIAQNWDWQYHPDFTGAPDLTLVGFARIVNDPPVTGSQNWLRITQASPGLQGAAWRSAKVPVVWDGAGFATEFRFILRAPVSGGGNGLAFAVQNTASSVSGNSWGPVGGSSLCVRFDTYRAAPAGPADSFIEIIGGGVTLGLQELHPLGINLRDGAPHMARIEFAMGKLRVELDGQVVFAGLPLDLAALGVVDEWGKAWVGFCASTGSWMQNHEVIDWRFRGTREPAATPVFSPDGGTYPSPQNVIITCATPQAAIRYTTDGSLPDAVSALYTGPVRMGEGTLSAIALQADHAPSLVKTAHYSLSGSTGPGHLKARPDGAGVGCESVVVTASAADGTFFVQAQDRSSAIAVMAPGLARPAVGSKVNIIGTVRTAASGERYIEATSITLAGSGQVRPLGLSIDALGGGPLELQEGIDGAAGLNNIGILARTWGAFSYGFPSFVIGGPGGPSAVVEVPWRSGIVADPDWMFVHLTGNVRCTRPASGAPLSRALRVRSVRELTGLPEQAWDWQCYPDFAGDSASIAHVGSACYVTDPELCDARRLRLTGNATGKTGSAWLTRKVPLSAGLTTKFAFQMSCPVNGGAEGLAFVIHNNPFSIGTLSSETGPAYSVAVTFDTYLGGGSEPSGNAVEVRSGGAVIAGVDLTPLGIDLKDEHAHLAEVRVAPVGQSHSITVRLDGKTVLSNVSVDLRSAGAMDLSGKSRIGFGARTGSGAENHDIVYWRLTERVTDPPGGPAPWGTIVVESQTDAERLATVDLQRYIAQVSGQVPLVTDYDTWRLSPAPALVVGTPDGNPLLKSLGVHNEDLGEQGYYIANRSTGITRLVVAAGLTPQGAVNAVYGLLRELGFGFYLGSEAIPDILPAALEGAPVVRQPVFRVRGVLPWYNFFNSPTTWDPVDHRAFADQLVRMGANFVGFHTYDHEPFAGYEENGQMHWAGRLLNTASPTWGTTPLSTNDSGYDTGKLFPYDFFGAATTIQIADPNEAIRAEQDIMRDALDYAKKRGLYTCLGFELFGDPLDPRYRDTFLKRLNRLLDQYPALDYIWLWQAETQGAQGFRQNYNVHILPSGPSPESLITMYGIARRDTFHRIIERTAGERPFFQDNEEGKIARANEGARLEQFAQLAYHTLAHREDPPGLVISGWGGDDRLLSAEYYDGLDKLLPQDVVFSSLDHISPRPRVDAVYNELPPERERWPIPWLENDGDQWHPQPFVHIYEGLARYAHAGGSQGILGIHWRTREISENFTYLVRYAWDPQLDVSGYFGDYARRCYDSRIADDMASIHSSLDSLGYRWVGGWGQTECGVFDWGPGDPQKSQALQVLRDRAAAHLPNAGKGADRLKWLVTEMDWVLRFHDAQVAAVQARGLIAQAQGTSDPNLKRHYAESALTLLDRDDFGQAIRNYARRVSTRGEHGVLATINTKALVAWRGLRSQCIQILGSGHPEGNLGPWQPEPGILMPRFVGTAPEGRDLELTPMVLGGGAAWVHYRTLGTQQWSTHPVQVVREWACRVAVPGSAVAMPGMQVGFSFSADPSQPMALGPVTITVLPDLAVNTAPRPLRQWSAQHQLSPNVSQGQAVPIELTWNTIHDADYYKVYRNGEPVVETAVAMFPDSPMAATGTYTVEACRNGAVIAGPVTVGYTVPDVPFTEQVVLEAGANNAGVLLRWPKPTSIYVTQYKISRNAPGGTPVVLGMAPASRTSEHVYQDVPPVGTWVYTVTPMNARGREGTPASKTVSYSPRHDIPPVIDLPLTSPPAGGSVVGSVAFGASGATFDGGYITMPHQDAMNLRYGMTMTFSFKANSTGSMPVLLSHGLWQIDGWYVQILGGKLVVRAPAGDAWGPTVQTGQWYDVRFVFDGLRFRLAVNGQWIEQEPYLIRDVPNTRSLVIGQYENKEPTFAFNGTLRSVRIYDDVVLE